MFEATLEELAQRGYSQLSLERVARRAGVHKTTLYRRWGTREALVFEVMLERASEQVPVPDTGSLRKDLLQLARTAVANASSPAVEAVTRTVIAELPHNRVLAEASRRFWEERMELDGEIVKRAIARGEVPEGTNPRLVVEAVLGPLHLRHLISGEPAEDRVIQHVVNLALAAAGR